ncbi:hypothetical protein CGC20_21535 [Leishmania donovani]|uniref:Uncharacterized protein n=1 Tax=Leishmania donovani TaxID=5661 RepID=A0A504XPB8_LEIDO|nr:hypothetical protein CGC20_21535 [Leishmania donovani]
MLLESAALWNAADAWPVASSYSAASTFRYMDEVITRVHARHRLQSSTAAMSPRQLRQVAPLITQPPPPHSGGTSSKLYYDTPEESASYSAEEISLSHALLHTIGEEKRVEQVGATNWKAFPERHRDASPPSAVALPPERELLYGPRRRFHAAAAGSANPAKRVQRAETATAVMTSSNITCRATFSPDSDADHRRCEWLQEDAAKAVSLHSSEKRLSSALSPFASAGTTSGELIPPSLVGFVAVPSAAVAATFPGNRSACSQGRGAVGGGLHRPHHGSRKNSAAPVAEKLRQSTAKMPSS